MIYLKLYFRRVSHLNRIDFKIEEIRMESIVNIVLFMLGDLLEEINVIKIVKLSLE